MAGLIAMNNKTLTEQAAWNNEPLDHETIKQTNNETIEQLNNETNTQTTIVKLINLDNWIVATLTPSLQQAFNYSINQFQIYNIDQEL